MDKKEKLEALKERLKELDSVAVAFSAGVDSSFLLKVAHDVLGDKCIAITGQAPFFSGWEQKEAIDFCKREGIKQLIVESTQLSDEKFTSNPSDRCYHCKKSLFQKMKDSALSEGISVLVEGSNLDDLGDYRPGLKAIEELGILSPLRDAGLTKQEIRELSKEMGLLTFDKPSFACLASRVPYGEEITPEKLKQIEKAEVFLMDLGFRNLRVRHHGTLARIEVPKSDMERVMKENVREEIVDGLKKIGFLYVTLDMQGYRMGSLNEVLS